MDKELLSFVIETLLLRAQPRMGATNVAPGGSVASQSSDQDVVREHAGAMRDLIAERVASNAGVIADTLMEVIKCNVRVQPDVIFELCDEILPKYQFIQTNGVTSIDPKLGRALGAICQYCNFSFTPPVQNICGNASAMYQQPVQQPPYIQPNDASMYQRQPVRDQSKDTSKYAPWKYNDPSMVYITQLQSIHTSLKNSVEEFIHTILSSKEYSPLTELRNCKSKVVIVHDSPYKDEIKAIADEKGMIVLLNTFMESDSIPMYSNQLRPELGLLLMINAYNSEGSAYLFPGRNKNSAYAVHEWTTIDNYVTIEKYINTTDGIRDELMRKAPDFLKYFDEDLAAIRRDYIGE